MITRYFEQEIRTFGEPNESMGLTEEEIQIDMLNWIKKARNAELQASDKYMNEDFPIDVAEKAEWKTYRNNLRDLFDTPRTFERGEDGMMIVDFWPSHPSINSLEDADLRNLQVSLQAYEGSRSPGDLAEVEETWPDGSNKAENPNYSEETPELINRID